MKMKSFVDWWNCEDKHEYLLMLEPNKVQNRRSDWWCISLENRSIEYFKDKWDESVPSNWFSYHFVTISYACCATSSETRNSNIDPMKMISILWREIWLDNDLLVFVMIRYGWSTWRQNPKKSRRISFSLKVKPLEMIYQVLKEEYSHNRWFVDDNWLKSAKRSFGNSMLMRMMDRLLLKLKSVHSLLREMKRERDVTDDDKNEIESNDVNIDWMNLTIEAYHLLYTKEINMQWPLTIHHEKKNFCKNSMDKSSCDLTSLKHRWKEWTIKNRCI